jgi:hypothetical protein
MASDKKAGKRAAAASNFVGGPPKRAKAARRSPSLLTEDSASVPTSSYNSRESRHPF